MSNVVETCYYDVFSGIDVSRVKLDDGARHISIEGDDNGVEDLLTRMTLAEAIQLVAALSSAIADHLNSEESES